ncbi:MAG TPA: hypothetical protein PKW35_22115 [Nannocystaceae bacterium]|nr:hypothetical protein [Nannocystaceae bacterium]
MQLMQRDLRRLLLALVATIPGCGPDEAAQQTESTWMLGIWSSESVGWLTNNCGVSMFDIRKDGTFFDGGYVCGTEFEPKFDTEYVWEHDGEDVIVVRPIGSNPADGWRITRGDDCETIVVAQIVGDTIFSPGLMYRGAVCMKDRGPCMDMGECEAYETVWCDGPPPPCDEDAP